MEDNIADLRADLARLSHDAGWRDGWKHRTGSPNACESALRVGKLILDQAAEDVARGDLATFESRVAWFRKVVSGEQYESVRPKPTMETVR